MKIRNTFGWTTLACALTIVALTAGGGGGGGKKDEAKDHCTDKKSTVTHLGKKRPVQVV